MLKILLAFLIVLDLGAAALLITGLFLTFKHGDISVVFPGIGIIISLSFFLGLIFIIEAGLILITWILCRYINSSGLR